MGATSRVRATYHTGAPGFTTGFQWVRVSRIATIDSGHNPRRLQLPYLSWIDVAPCAMNEYDVIYMQT